MCLLIVRSVTVSSAGTKYETLLTRRLCLMVSVTPRLLVITKGDEGWCGTSGFEEMKFREEILAACHMVCTVIVWDRVG